MTCLCGENSLFSQGVQVMLDWVINAWEMYSIEGLPPMFTCRLGALLYVYYSNVQNIEGEHHFVVNSPVSDFVSFPS